MLVYLLTIVAVIVLLLLNRERIISNKATLFWSLFIMAIVVGLRGIGVGEDTASYLRVYKYSKDLSLSDIFSNFPYGKYYTWSYGYSEKTESFTLLFSKIIMLLFNSEYVVQFITSCLTFLLFGLFIKDNTKDYKFPILVLLCEYVFFSSFNLARQFFAIGVALQSIKFFLKRKKVFIGFLFVLIACLIHVSSVFFVSLIPIFLLKKKKYIFIYTTVSTCLILFLLEPIFNLLMRFLPFLNSYESYFNEQMWGFRIGGTALLWLFIVFLFVLVFIRKAKMIEKIDFIYLGLFVLYIALEIVNISRPIFSRVVCYLRVFLILIIPYLIAQMSKKDRAVVAIIAVILLFGQFISYSNNDSRSYSFLFDQLI